MIFKAIPKNGSSWREPLPYEVEFAEDEQQVEVDIYDQISATVIGRLRLSANGANVVDIAPYIRSAMANRVVLPEPTSTISQSPAACLITLRTEGTTSPQRLYFREDISSISSQLLSSVVENATIANGEVIRITAYAQSSITVTLLQPSSAGGTKNYSHRPVGIPCEITIPINGVGIGETIVVRVRCDGGESTTHTFSVVERNSSARRVAWINTKGGVECYTFPQSTQRNLTIKSQEIESELGWYRRVVESRLVRRLLLHGSTLSEIDRVLGIFLSPVIYLCEGNQTHQVRLLTDEVTFDDHGKVRKLEFDIEELWRGGALQCA